MRSKIVVLARLAPAVALALWMGSMCAGCAYFNTYYNSKTAFQQANRQHLKAIGTTLDSLTIPDAGVLTKYQRAYDKSAKVLEVYPKAVKWHDDAVFMMSQVSFYKTEYTKAIRQLKQFQKEYPASPHIPRSYLLLGRAYLYDGNVQKAEETLLLARDRYAQLDEDDELSLLLAHIAVAREGKSMALEMLQKVRSTVKTEEKRLAVTLDMAELHAQLGQHAKAIELLGEIPNRKNLPDLMFRRDFLLLQAYGSVDSLDRALHLAEAMLKVREYDKNQAKILLQKGSLQYRRGEYQKAVATYELLLEQQKTGAEAAQAAFELATIYQYKLVDFKKAKEYYAKAGELAGQDDEHGVVARKRLAALNRLEDLSARAWPSDSAPLPDTSLSQQQRDSVRTVNRFAMSELYWLELQQPDSAYAHFLRLAADSTLSGQHTAKALYSASWIALFSQKDTTAFDSLFAQLTLRFPSDAFTKQAQLDRGYSSTVTTPQDSAAKLFGAAEQLYVQDNNPLAAANAYLKVYKSYPTLELAPKSLYASAWLCDNELYKKETAKMLYEKLCAEYPLSEYCLQGARPRIKVAMDTLQALKAAQ